MMEDKIINLIERDMQEIPSLKQDIALIKQDISYVKRDMNEMKCILEELANRPKEHWNTIISVLITVIVTAVVNFVFFLTNKGI